LAAEFVGTFWLVLGGALGGFTYRLLDATPESAPEPETAANRWDAKAAAKNS
jgi:glycerol uptake facilitator-like aquaporin